MKMRLLTLALAVVLVFMSSFAFYKIGFRIGENRALESMETPGISRPATTAPNTATDPAGTTPTQNRPGQTTGPVEPTEPTNPTEPTQPAVCQHEYSRGECVHCGALKPTDGLEYTLNEDGKSYTLTRGWIDTYYDYRVVIADVYKGLPVTAIGESAFKKQYGNYYLTSVHIPDTITTIGQGAFYGCSGLTSVTIPDSVTTIGNSAFNGCNKLNTVSLGKNVTSIGEDAFLYCKALTTIYWSEQTVTIGQDAFTYCENLKKIHLANIASWCAIDFVYSYRYRGDSVTSPFKYGAKLYLNGELITDLVIPEGVTRIGDYAFYCYDDLKSVTIPDSVTTIGDYAFAYCDALTTVTMGDGVTTIGGSAFSACSALTTITLGNGVTSIGVSAFSSCKALTSVSIPDSVSSIDPFAFTGCENLTYKRYDTALYMGNEQNPYVYLVKASAKDISGCNIHKNTKIIAASAFKECTGLTKIIIPDQVVSVGASAFERCENLAEIIIGDSVTTLGQKAFYLCANNITVTVGKSLRFVGEYAFWDDSSYSYYNYNNPVSVVYIDDLAMWLNVEFENIKDNPLSDGASLHVNDSLLTELVVPKGVTTIGQGFRGYSQLTSVVLPEGVTSIGDYAFYGCGNLVEITIPNSLETTGKSTFEGCKKIEKVHISSIEAWCTTNFGDYYSNPLYAEAELLLNGQLVAELVLPAGMTTIGSYVFDGYGKLTKVVLPEGIISIGAGAFNGCVGLTEITIPATVTAIDDKAFSSCSNLATITFAGTLEQWYAVALGENWKNGAPVKQVICKDGIANL